jgi:hypothetical protein
MWNTSYPLEINPLLDKREIKVSFSFPEFVSGKKFDPLDR